MVALRLEVRATVCHGCKLRVCEKLVRCVGGDGQPVQGLPIPQGSRTTPADGRSSQSLYALVRASIWGDLVANSGNCCWNYCRTRYESSFHRSLSSSGGQACGVAGSGVALVELPHAATNRTASRIATSKKAGLENRHASGATKVAPKTREDTRALKCISPGVQGSTPVPPPPKHRSGGPDGIAPRNAPNPTLRWP